MATQVLLLQLVLLWCCCVLADIDIGKVSLWPHHPASGVLVRSEVASHQPLLSCQPGLN